jgi:aromatic-L-amino-acid decarboxylase
VPLSVVCFRALPAGLDGADRDAFNLRLVDRVNAAGDVFLSHTRLDDGIALRVAIGNLGTTAADIDRCHQLLLTSLRELTDSGETEA